MSAFFLRFKANYPDKMRGYPYFSLWIPIALCKDLLFPHGPNLAQKPLYLVGNVLKSILYEWARTQIYMPSVLTYSSSLEIKNRMR